MQNVILIYICCMEIQEKKTTDQLKLANQICFPIYALAKETVNFYRPLLDELDLTYPQYLVMLVLWEKEEQTVSQLGEKLLLDSGTLTPLLKRLEQKHLIKRCRSSVDERVVNITLTEQGNAMKEKAMCIPARLLQSLNVSLEDLTTLKEIIQKILNQKK